MNAHKKTIITVLLVFIVVGVFVFQSQNKSLFQGRLFGLFGLFGKDTPEESEDSLDTDEKALPDLTIDLKVIAPSEEGGDLSVDVTIGNEGAGSIAGNEPFKYGIYLNDIEIFANTDSYTSMEPGDSFNFIYPISKLIYQYPESGTASVVVDMDDNVDEANENNNSKEVDYFL